MCQGRVTMSSICPRLDTVDVQRKIELTNTALKNLCDTHSCRFVNNDNFFKLADKTVNDSLVMRDRVHLTWQPSNKLALNLKLKTTEKCVSLYRSRGRPRQTRYASNYRRSDVNQTRRDWSNAFNTVVSKHVKIKEIRVKDRSNPWMTNEILAFIYKRDYTHRMAWPH